MKTPFPILWAEDDTNDVFLFTRCFRRFGGKFDLHVVRDGQAAISYLSGEGKYANRRDHPLPVLILLDIKMPKCSGFEVLEWVKKHPAFHDLPIIMFSSSNDPHEVEKALSLGVSAYMTKGGGVSSFEQSARMIYEFCLKLRFQTV